MCYLVILNIKNQLVSAWSLGKKMSYRSKQRSQIDVGDVFPSQKQQKVTSSEISFDSFDFLSFLFFVMISMIREVFYGEVNFLQIKTQ